MKLTKILPVAVASVIFSSNVLANVTETYAGTSNGYVNHTSKVSSTHIVMLANDTDQVKVYNAFFQVCADNKCEKKTYTRILAPKTAWRHKEDLSFLHHFKLAQRYEVSAVTLLIEEPEANTTAKGYIDIYNQ